MKKILQRILNVITLMAVVTGVTMSFGNGSTIKDGIGMLFIGLCFVLVLNYIFFGKITIWNKIERDE